jgi:tetratricopeptide (TPR) repeat protein
MTGKKAELQQRLLIWATIEGRKRVKDRLMGLKDLIQTSKSKGGSSTLDNLEYDVDALTNKRKALRKEKRRGAGSSNNNRGILGLVDESYFSNTTSSSSIDTLIDEDEDEGEEYDDDDSIVDEASISQLSKTFNAPASTYSNRDVREMYIEAKALDQEGDREKSKNLLRKLREATPHDMRVVRRLARMEQEDGNISAARGLLQRALRVEPGNAYLMQGLGQLERQAGNDATAKNHFRKAIKENPTFANPYHALGTLEHTHGNIKAALAVIKDGLRKCPRNHRLHHALGDVYLDANMLDLAEESYLEGLQHGPEWSKAFFYTSLSFVSYAKGQVQECRTLLRQSLDINGGMHAQGVIALAQLEESEGNIQAAREVYRDAISRYEKRRRKRSPFRSKSPGEEDMFDSPSLVDEDGKQYSRSYSGDKWVNVFKSWARMEEIHGTYETAHIVFSKAARLFPNNMSLLIQWADLQSDHGEDEKGRLLYEAACQRAGDGSAKPYQALAEFEMKRKNFVKAQSILFRGAQCAASSNGIADGKSGLARLFHTWGVCEYHLGNESRAQQLLEDALRVTGPGEADSTMRSLILYSMARLEVLRGEHLLAQHCIGLSLKENLLPGGNSLIWKLWAEIAEKMENKDLEKRCKEQALLRWEEERGGTVSDLSRLLGARSSDSSSRLPERTGSVMKDMFRKTPWSSKVCHTSGRMDRVWYQGANLWKL